MIDCFYRKSAPAAVVSFAANSKNPQLPKELFQNGISAPHMLGNQLNMNSNMAPKMAYHLNSELEVHSIYTNDLGTSRSGGEIGSSLVGPQLHHRVVQSARSSSTTSTASANSGGMGSANLTTMLGGAIPQTLDQLLERQWEQGSQFLMEQAQHFDSKLLCTYSHIYHV